MGHKGHTEETPEDTDKSHVDPQRLPGGERERPPMSALDRISRTAHWLHRWEPRPRKKTELSPRG